MNQAVGETAEGTPFLVLSLDPGNLHRLKKGDPILLRVHDLFPDGMPKKLELMIGFSSTPIKDARELAEMADIVFDERSIGAPKRPHCPECRSTIEQLGVQRNESPLAIVYCAVCGCIFGTVPSGSMQSINVKIGVNGKEETDRQ